MMRERKLNDAVRYFQRSIELDDNFAEAHNNLGSVLRDQGQLDAAVACYRRALQLKPNDVQPNYNLGVGLREQGNLDEAAAYCHRALELNPEDADLYSCLGNVLTDQGKLGRRGRLPPQGPGSLDPDSAEAHKALGMTLLKAGNWEQVWSEDHWRWRTWDFTERQLPRPLWDGQHLAESTIVLHAEQGLGDTIDVRALRSVGQGPSRPGDPELPPRTRQDSWPPAPACSRSRSRNSPYRRWLTMFR